MYKRSLCFAKDSGVSQGKLITVLTNGMRNLIIQKYQEMPSVGTWFPPFPLISSLQAPTDYSTDLFSSSQMLQSSSEEREFRMLLRVTAPESNSKGLKEN